MLAALQHRHLQDGYETHDGVLACVDINVTPTHWLVITMPEPLHVFHLSVQLAVQLLQPHSCSLA
jgi:hypothetical protein